MGSMCESIIQNTATSNKRISSLFRSISPAEEAAVEMGGAMKVMCPWKAIFLKSGIFLGCGINVFAIHKASLHISGCEIGVQGAMGSQPVTD